MRSSFLTLLFFLFTLPLIGQVRLEQGAVVTVEEALHLSKAHPGKVKLIQLHAAYDTVLQYRKLFKEGVGGLVHHEEYTYQVISDTSARFSRVQYIFLEGSRYNKSEIDSLRRHILSQHESGVLFRQLAAQYNMDGGTGDTGWFTEGTMVREFERAIGRHARGAVYSLDIPSKNWYYLVQKTHDTRWGRLLLVLKVHQSVMQ